jgi:N-acetylglutamate synthase
MIIRAMMPTDLAAASELWAAAEGVELAEGDSQSDLAKYLARNPGCSQVAFEQDRLIAAVLAGHDGRRGFLYHLAVHPSARGRGVGKQLASAAVRAIKGEGIQRVLILVAADNPQGVAFWQKCGWENMPFALPMGLDT